jgi:hypothetical protein
VFPFDNLQPCGGLLFSSAMTYENGKLKPSRCSVCGDITVWVPGKGWCCPLPEHDKDAK